MSKLDKYIIDNKEAFESDNHMFYTRIHPILAYSRHVDEAFEKAFKEESKLTKEMTFMSVTRNELQPEEKLFGLSGSSFRHLMNNLANLKGANYLEVGVWKGSTLISTIFGNENLLNEVHAIDNFSEFDEDGTVEKEFNWQLDKFLPNTKHVVNFHKEDAFKIDLKKLPKFDIFFYDGHHSEESQYLAFKYFEDRLADTCIVIVDDWEQRQVRAGTRRGLEAIDYKIVTSKTVMPGRRKENANRVNNPVYDWWNGVFVAVLTKELTDE